MPADDAVMTLLKEWADRVKWDILKLETWSVPLVKWVSENFPGGLKLGYLRTVITYGYKDTQGFTQYPPLRVLRSQIPCCFCSLSHVQPFATQQTGIPVLHHLLELAQIHVHRVGDAIQQSHPLLSPSPPALSLSQHQRPFYHELALCIRWPKYWSFSFSISPFNEYSVLISFRIDWFDLAIHGILLESSLAPQFESINSWALNLQLAS